MLKFLSKVKIDFNAFDPRAASALEFLAQCSSLKARDSNPSCQVIVNRRTDEHHPQITITYSNGIEESIDGSITNAQTIRKKILETGRMLETQQMFKEAGQSWPVMIPEEELYQFAKPTKAKKAQEK
ncbi:hypothetical protein SUGI_0559730 [Cryptomeria japonica]|nr:hypothetical protein SUGI_0559730 [Cryptomeria japonica]